jgi:hypothetical protein
VSLCKKPEVSSLKVHENGYINVSWSCCKNLMQSSNECVFKETKIGRRGIERPRLGMDWRKKLEIKQK